MGIRKINIDGLKDNEPVEVHIVLPVWLYKQVYTYQLEAIGEPSLSGIMRTALRQLLDMVGYLKAPDSHPQLKEKDDEKDNF